MDSNYSSGSRYAYPSQSNSAYGYDSIQATYQYENDGKDKVYYPHKVNIFSKNAYKIDSAGYEGNTSQPLQNTSMPTAVQIPTALNVSQPYKSCYSNSQPQYMQENNAYYSYYEQYKYQPTVKANTHNMASNVKAADYHDFKMDVFSPKAMQGTTDSCLSAKTSNISANTQTIRHATQYPYHNYNIHTSSHAYQPNQTFCSRQQQVALDNNRWVWNDYHHNYRGHAALPPADRSFNEYNPELYNKEIISHVASNNGTNCYNTRTQRHAWGHSSVQYQSPVSQNHVAYDRSVNYTSGNQGQSVNCCPTRQEEQINRSYYQPGYPKYPMTTPNIEYAKFYDSSRVAEQYNRYNGIHNSVQAHSSNLNQSPYKSYGYPVNESIIQDKNELHQYREETAYQHSNFNYNSTIYDLEPNAKLSQTKAQSLRDFLTTWNEDEDDTPGPYDKTLSEDNVYVNQQQSNVLSNEHLEASIDNHLQFKGSFSTRPKIHVGITVDSSVGSDQYINLPDIIIDIEKSKEPSAPVPAVKHASHDIASNYNICVKSPNQTIPADIEKDDLEPVEISDKILNEDLSLKSNVLSSIATRELAPAFQSHISKLPTDEITDHHEVSCSQISIQSLKSRRRAIYNKRLCAKRLLEKKSKQYALRKLRQFRPQRLSKIPRLNPKSLKNICIEELNSERFRNFFELHEWIDIELKQSHGENTIPKLSDLCKNALSSSFNQSLDGHGQANMAIELDDEENVVVINLDEIIDSDNLFILQCDINENVVTAERDDIYVEHEIETLNSNNSSNIQLQDNDLECDQNCSVRINNNNDYNCNYNKIDVDEPFCENYDDSIHHEEIVPDNYRQFQKDKLLKYLHEKYVQRNGSHRYGCTNKIIKKYKRKHLRNRMKIVR